MPKRFVVVGLGNFGASAVRALFEQGHEVVAVDTDPDAVDRVAGASTRAAVADGRQPEVLRRAGAADADVGVVSTGDDITASILSTLALLDIGVREVHVKVVSAEHARVMNRVGAAGTIFPERDAAVALARRLEGRHVLDYVRIGDTISIQEVAVPGAWLGKTLRELDLRAVYGVSAVAVHDVLTDRVAIPPDPDAALVDSDTLLLAGTDAALDRTANV